MRGGKCSTRRSKEPSDVSSLLTTIFIGKEEAFRRLGLRKMLAFELLFSL